MNRAMLTYKDGLAHGMLASVVIIWFITLFLEH